MLRGIIIAVLSIAVVGTGYWGYQEHKEKNAILVNAENTYQRAFHDLTYQMDLLHDKIGTSLAMNSKTSLSPALAEVWRITSEAHNDVGQLPLTLLPFNKTEEFLADIGEFTYRTAVRDLDKNPLSDKEYQNLQSLYKQSADIQKDLRQVQHLVLKNNLRWMDVELALASGKENADNTIIDGFKTVEKTVEGFSENNFGPTEIGMRKKDERFRDLKGPKISQERAVEIAKKYSPYGSKAEIRVTKNGKGSDYGFYSIDVKSPEHKAESTIDITEKGGYPIWFIVSRELGNQKLSLNEAGNRAVAFVKENKFEDFELFESFQFDSVGIFTFVGSKNGVRIYPDTFKVKVALDNGGIIGFSGEDYLKSHHERNNLKPSITVEEAMSKVNPNVKIMDKGLAVILSKLNKEVLCHEFTGTMGKDTYRIFVNAETGEEEQVEKLDNVEPNF
ncbi:germination protein YpeB [Mesobacillus zeae]|uniref:Germination protein YpeB n=1 Tax=Mesobacillus zeae TaxID=1917180 RepID=A0A398BIV9_9BACI|nr:germination protein YpeB [Mesobacillus zeae]RID87313.1 germination protein YpeB [Mesobacillus zeae]